MTIRTISRQHIGGAMKKRDQRESTDLRPIIHSCSNQPANTGFDALPVCRNWVSLCEPRRKLLGLAKLAKSLHEANADAHQSGRDHEANKRNYHNRTIHGPTREAQAYLTRKLGERDLGRDLEGAKITLNEYLDRWLETAVRPRVRAKNLRDYQGMLGRCVRLGRRDLTDRPAQRQRRVLMSTART